MHEKLALKENASTEDGIIIIAKRVRGITIRSSSTESTESTELTELTELTGTARFRLVLRAPARASRVCLLFALALAMKRDVAIISRV